MTDVYVAKHNAHVTHDGTTIRIKKGVTRIAADHALVARFPGLFGPAEPDVRFEVRDTRAHPQATTTPTAGPAASATVSKYADLKGKDLKAEIATRNHDRPAETQIKPASSKVADMVAALEVDDRG